LTHAIQLKGNDHGEEANAHAISELGHERGRSADLYGLRWRRQQPGPERCSRRTLRRAIAGNWNKKGPLAAIASGPMLVSTRRTNGRPGAPAARITTRTIPQPPVSHPRESGRISARSFLAAPGAFFNVAQPVGWPVARFPDRPATLNEDFLERYTRARE